MAVIKRKIAENNKQIVDNTNALLATKTKIVENYNDISNAIVHQGGTVYHTGEAPTTDDLIAGILSIQNNSGSPSSSSPILMTGNVDPTPEMVGEVEHNAVQFYLNEINTHLFFLHEIDEPEVPEDEHSYEWVCLNGSNGVTPQINENGNWCIGDIDTGVHATIDGPGIQIIEGSRTEAIAAITNGDILENNIIITRNDDNSSEILFYDKDKTLNIISHKTKFDSLAEASAWVKKYDCDGLIFTVHTESGWTPYVVQNDRTLMPVDNGITGINDTIKIDGGTSEGELIITTLVLDGGTSHT